MTRVRDRDFKKTIVLAWSVLHLRSQRDLLSTVWKHKILDHVLFHGSALVLLGLPASRKIV